MKSTIHQPANKPCATPRVLRVGVARTPRQSGFAVLLALSLMSFVLVIVLSLVLMASVETANAANAKDRLLARENARLGLMIALGELQKHAGPDQRVTARAEILGTLDADNDPEGRRFWTGVWDTAEPETPVIWLVSGDSPSLETDTDSTLIGPETVGDASQNYVSAPSIQFDGGEISWWIGDEGVKSSIAMTKSLDSPGPDLFPTLSSNEERRIAYNIPERMGMETIVSPKIDENTYEFSPEAQENRDRLINVDSVTNLDLFDNLLDKSEALFYHDLTAKAYGVLARTDGMSGLRRDLSRVPDALGQQVSDFVNFKDYLVPIDETPLINDPNDLRRIHRIVPPPAASPTAGEPIHSVAPILTDFGIQFGFRVNNSLYPRVILAMKSAVEMWNPYSSALLPEELIIEVSGLEPIQITPINNKTNTPESPITVDPHEYYGEPIRFRLDFSNMDTSSKIKPGSYDAQIWGPGRLVYWVGQSENLAVGQSPEPEGIQLGFGNNNASKSFYINTGLEFPEATIPQADDLSLSFTIPETTLSISLKRASDEATISDYDNLSFLTVNNSTPFLATQWPNNHVGFQFRLRERGGTVDADPSIWLKFSDPRKHNASLDLSELLDDYTATYVWRENVFPEELPISYGNTLQLSQSDAPEYFTYRSPTISSSEHAGFERDAPLFELPRQPLISLGALQHLQVAEAPPFSFGNSWGDNLNSAFDQFFFSGLDDTLIDDFAGTPPNPRLMLVNPAPSRFPVIDVDQIKAQTGSSSMFFLVDGSFNLNSTSVNAWKSVLSSNSIQSFIFADRSENQLEGGSFIQTASDIIDSDSSGEPYQLPSFYTRFPQSFQELFQRDISTSLDPEQRAPYQFFQQGFKILSPRVGNQNDSTDYSMTDTEKIDALAEAIVFRIKSRTVANGRPFLSIKEFLAPTTPGGPSLLEAAISDVPELHRDRATSSLNTVEIDERLPGHLSQADVMNALAPIASVRSDTFLIRVKGKTMPKIDNSGSAEAICEALVQRLVTPVDFGISSDLSEIATPANNFGRQFKILSLRWLNEESI